MLFQKKLKTKKIISEIFWPLNAQPLNSVKSSLPVEQPETDVDAVGDDQGVSYNLTGKLKVIDDMLINETQVHEEIGKN